MFVWLKKREQEIVGFTEMDDWSRGTEMMIGIFLEIYF
jgi:hypothetical protein